MKTKSVVSLLAVLILLVGFLTPACGPKPLFEVTSLTTSPDEAAPGQEVMVSATVENVGPGEGIYSATLTVDGEIVGTEAVSLAPGSKQTITFMLVKDEVGTYSIEIDGLTATLEVVKPAEFQVSALGTTPAEIVAGEEFTIDADIRNVGGVEGTYTATLRVDGKVVESKDITVDAGATKKASFTYSLEVAGAHTIELGGATTPVTALKPAELEVRSLQVTPALVLPGQEATVEVDVANVGEVKGTVTATLTVNGVETDTRPVTLDAGAAETVSFTVVRDLAGAYDLSVSGAGATLAVAEVETYTSEQYHYLISYPSGWVLDDSAPDSVGAVKVDIAGVGVDVAILPVAASLNELYALIVEEFRAESSDFEVLSRQDVTENETVVGAEVIAEFTQEGTPWKLRLILFKMGRYGFSVWGVVRETVYEENKPLLDACLESFKPPVVATGSYENTTHGLSMTLPGGWDALETGKRWPLVYVRSAVGQPYMATWIYLERIYETKSAKEHALEFVESFRKYDDFRTTAEREVTLGVATTGYEFEFTYTYLIEGERYITKRKVVSVIDGSRAFTIIVYAAPSTFKSLRSTMDRLVHSFTLVEPRPFGVSRQTSIFYRWGEIVTLDPALGEGSPGGIIGAIFSGLVRIDRELKVVPDIAEKWEVSDDGKTYTFHLREGVKFHDGKPVTAHDFKYSWERACDPETESRKARLFLGDIVGAKEMLAGEATELKGVRVIDDLTLEVTIDGPKPYFLGKLSYITAYVVDRANVARGINWTDKPNGTGPFKLKEWKKDELLILERNDNDYLEPAKLENVVFQIFAGRSMMMYEQGEIDTTGVGLANLERVLDPTDPLNKELLTTPSLNMSYLGFNVTMPPFDDPKVRRAFALALDMDKILEVSLKGNSERAAGFVPPGIPGHNEGLEPLPFDPEQAKQLIVESKYGSVANLPPIVFYTLYSLGSTEEAMIGMWQQNLGVKVEAQVIEELEEWYEMAHGREFQLFSSGWQADYIDPQNFLEVFFHSQSEENRFAYANPEVDAALEKAAVERDEETRLKMYQEIEKLILEELPAVPFYQSSKRNRLVKPYVEGFYPLPSIGINFWRDISIKPH